MMKKREVDKQCTHVYFIYYMNYEQLNNEIYLRENNH